MGTIGWLAIIIGGLLIRQVSKGRASDVPSDLGDLFVGIVTGDTSKVADVVSRTGTSAYTPVATPVNDSGTATVTGGAAGSAVLAAAMKRGAAAKGYRFGTYPPDFGVGPNWYDCSGLVGKALQDSGYKVGRITTYTWPSVARKIGFQKTTKPVTGDIVVWQRGGTSGHMGIVTSGGKFYAAQNSRTGIKELPISNISGSISYWHHA
jgi:cell wall-associated NlpC family hydrolase